MKALKVILIILLVIFAGYCIWMFTLPEDYTLERSTVVDAKPAVVFAEVNNLEAWPEWSPWIKMDTTMQMEYSENTSGTGAYYKWKGNETMSGSYTNAEVVDNEYIRYDMEFEGMGNSDGYWKFEPVNENQTKVTWGFHTKLGFFNRVGSVFMDDALGSQFEQGLADLKTIAESRPQEPEVNIVMATNTPVAYYAITDKVSFRDMNPDFFAQRYGELGTYLGKDAENMTGAPFAIYNEWDEENKVAVVSVALPVTSDKPGNDRIKKGMTPEGQVLKAVYMGPYEGTGVVHAAMDEYIKSNALQMTGSPWEVYVTDPGEEPDSSKWVTEIYYPVAASSATETGGTGESQM